MTNYFTHDYNAQHDEKIVRLVKEMGWEAYGLYWAIVERIYNNGDSLLKDYESISFALQVTPEKIKKIVENFELFDKKSEKIISKSILKRLKERKKISNKRKKAAQIMHKKQQDFNNANAEQMHSKCTTRGHAIKEKKNKGKERKGKNIKEETTTSNDMAQTTAPDAVNAIVVNQPKTVQAEFVEQFKKLYEQRTEQSYNDKKTDYIITAQLIKRHGLKSVVDKVVLLCAACDSQSLWFTKDGWGSFTIDKLSARWNEILAPPEKEKSDDKWRKIFEKQEADCVNNTV